MPTNQPYIYPKASSTLPSTLDQVKALESHPQFSLQNPNKARALVAAFARNAVLFHAVDGSGYAYVCARVSTRRIQVAA